MKIDNINEKLVKKRNRFVIIRDIVKTKSITRIIDNMKFAKENTKKFYDDPAGVTINIKCRYIGCVHGKDLFEWIEEYSCGENVFSSEYYITGRDKKRINIWEDNQRKVR